MNPKYTRGFEKLTEVTRAAIAEGVASYISDIDVFLNIDGMRMGPEESTEEIDRSGEEINININLGIREIIINHPEEYKDELHYPLFNDTERAEIEKRKSLIVCDE